MRRIVSTLTCLVGLTFARWAAADSDSERARALFDEAGQLERDGRWPAAQDRLRAALRLRETANLHYALGWALENDDKLLQAKSEYEAAQRLARERRGGDEAARLAAVRLVELERKFAMIRIRLSGPARASARVLLDGHEVANDNVVDPGSHVVRVERGEGPSEQTVYVGRGASRIVEVDVRVPRAAFVTATELPVATLPTTGQSPRSGQSVVPWLLTTGGIAFVVGGTALLGSAATDSDGRGAKEGLGFGLGGLGIVAVSVGAIMLLRGETRPVSFRF